MHARLYNDANPYTRSVLSMNKAKRVEKDPLKMSHRNRSNYIRRLVQARDEAQPVSTLYSARPSRRIIHFWNDLDKLPDDVKECMESWTELEAKGFELLLFDSDHAREYIDDRLGVRYSNAFDRCYHPAMQSDYFRLCYIFTEGGCYVDSDDVYLGREVDHLFSDSRLKIQPLCYDISTNEMIEPTVFTRPEANSLNWIFYFNNNPLIAPDGNPIVERALSNATNSLEKYSPNHLPDIQSATGPGNLSKAIFDLACEKGNIGLALLIVRDWESIASVKWPLGYRNDERNWRLSNRQAVCGSSEQERTTEEK
jgi:mannosyltransferase OCH1-like enzyme